jgi:hypothetical protein
MAQRSAGCRRVCPEMRRVLPLKYIKKYRHGRTLAFYSLENLMIVVPLPDFLKVYSIPCEIYMTDNSLPEEGIASQILDEVEGVKSESEKDASD